MDFVDHMNDYYKGERLGAICYTIGGIFFLLLAMAIWKVAAPGTITRGMLVPITIVGLLGVGAGPFLLRSNNNRLDRFPKEYAADATGFVEKEARRMARVHRNWLPLKVMWTVLLAIGVGFAFFGGSPTWKGIGLGVLVIGTIGHVVDGIASQRSWIYVEQLQLLM